MGKANTLSRLTVSSSLLKVADVLPFFSLGLGGFCGKRDEAEKGGMKVRGILPFPRSSISAFVSAVRQLEQRALIRSSLRPTEMKTFINTDSQHTEREGRTSSISTSSFLITSFIFGLAALTGLRGVVSFFCIDLR